MHTPQAIGQPQPASLPSLLTAFLAALVLMLTACQAPRASSPPEPGSTAARDRAPAALLAGKRIPRDELLTLLAEASGGRILEEIILDRAIAARLQTRGLTITEADATAERDALLAVLASEVGLDPDATARIEQAVRNARGLGPERWDRLLRRSAGLRALVRDEVDTSDAALRLAHAERTTPTVIARVIEVPDQRTASDILERVRRSDNPAATFLAAAVDESDSPSRGQLLAIRAVDPVVPDAIRRAVRQLDPGQVSGVIATERGFAIARVERTDPGDTRPFDDARDDLARSVRLRQESVLMARLAEQLLESERLTIFDPALNWSWTNTR